MDDRETLLELTGVFKQYPVHVREGALIKRRYVKAVNDVSLRLRGGETLALVGESGCGKSSTARVMLGLSRPDAGTISYAGEPVSFGRRDSRFHREVQGVFQDPAGSLNPRKSIAESMTRPLRLNEGASKSESLARAVELLDLVGLTPPEDFLARFPHEMSGGQLQRVAIARALTLSPRVIVADEPVSALDVSIRAQVLNTLRDVQRRTMAGIVLITHDLSVVRAIADRVAVMYLGRIVETGTVDSIFRSPSHPYTRLLLSAAPEVHRRNGFDDLDIIGEVPSSLNPPPGCSFNPRCPLALTECSASRPVLEGSDLHSVACHVESVPELNVL